MHYSKFLILLCCFAINAKSSNDNEKNTYIGCKDSNNENGDQKLSCVIDTLNGLNVLVKNLTTSNGLARNVALKNNVVNSLNLMCNEKFSNSEFINRDIENSYGSDKNSVFNVYLQELNVKYCKIDSIPSRALESFRNLKSFSLHTHNAEWSTVNLDLNVDSFEGLPSLRNLNLAHNNIWTIPKNTFCALQSLKYLNISNNHINDVQLGYGLSTRDSRSCNIQLEVLDVSYNNIINIPNKSFATLKYLLILKLDSNHISMLDDGSFDGLLSLQHLNLTNNKLIALPPELFNSTKDLRQLYVSHNTISVLAPGLFENLNKLQILDLSYNELTSSWVNRETLQGLAELVILKLNNNKLQSLDRNTLQELRNLQYLNLEANEIEVIAQSTFADLKNLEQLILSKNSLKVIESRHFSDLRSLNQLLLDSNRIKSIHRDAFKNLTNLHDLALSDNLLEEIPNSLKNLKNLKSLDLGKNKIMDIDSDSFEGLYDLAGLRLTDNEITTITKNAFAPLKSLHVLNLASNKIKHIDQAAFSSNAEIRAIRLDSNNLDDMSSAFITMKNLILLNVSENYIKWFDYSYLPNSLEWLDIHNNNITEIGNYNDGTNDLRIVWMDASNNKIKTINKNLIPKNIEIIDLSHNLIEEIPSGTFLNKKQLRKISLQGNLIRNLQITSLLMSKISVDRELPEVYLSENPFHCDCSMEWLKNINELSDQRRQHPKLRDIKDIKCTLEHNHGQNDMRPVKFLQDLVSSEFLCKYENNCFPECKCCNEDENPMNNSDSNCNCQITCPDQCSCYHDNSWNRNIVDCGEADLTLVPLKLPNDVTTLYLDGNNIPKLTYSNFIGKKRLEALYLNNSNIEKIAANSFDDLKNLRILRLNNNKLGSLNGNEFSNQLLLNKLYLDHNQIGNIAENTFVHLKYLKVIDLSNNRLVDFDPIKQLTTSSSTGALSKVFLDGDNKWNCDCKSLLKLVEWIKHRTENFNLNRMVCTDNRIVGDVLNNCQIISSFDYNSNRENNIENSTPYLSNEMKYHKNMIAFDSNYDQAAWLTGSGGYISIFAAVLVTVFVVALLIAIICVFKQDIKLLTFDKFGVRLFDCARKTKRNQVHQCNHPNDHMAGDECYTEKTYDAFLISSMNDRDLLTQVIVPEMQNMGYSVSCYNQHYKTLHPHNNHYSGSYLMDTFKYGSDCSHKTVLVISLNFLQNEWCDNSFRFALQSIIDAESTKNNKLVLILTVPIQIIQMDPILQTLLKNSTVICWGEKRFWSKLRYELPDVNKGLLNKYPNNLTDSFGNVRYTSAPTATMQSARSVNTAYNPGGWYNSHPLLCSGYSSPLNYKQQYYTNANNMMLQHLPYEYCTPEYTMSNQNVPNTAEQSNEADNLQHVYSTIPETISISGSSNASSDSLKNGEV